MFLIKVEWDYIEEDILEMKKKSVKALGVIIFLENDIQYR
ncbi:hypothetical protein LMHCC_2713 [Listeria monocytogenes HCC23]|uniref:Uncharacterized protein n=1 Tax=Listeria monocytogenes serotype 4a (strain M7) TaxID=1030009 RepID=A0A0E0V012_LISMM|nr:hypothetical protein LMHCC_2713 [Listeria monocytogenes HCC23]AEH93934.1 hypothetical protein LMM7_2929 [Listeria monocytogenes M7]